MKHQEVNQLTSEKLPDRMVSLLRSAPVILAFQNLAMSTALMDTEVAEVAYSRRERIPLRYLRDFTHERTQEA